MTVLSDLRRAARSLAQRPWFSLAAITSLAFGIGANTTVFTITALAFVAIALLAAYGPARRAGRVEPTVAMSDDR